MAITKNVGGTDRAIRIILGIVLLSLVSLAFVGPQTPWAYLLGLIGLALVVSGITGFCLPYKLLGINTCKNIEKC